MYKIPTDFDVTVFVGRSLDVASFTANSIHLRFDGAPSLSVTVERVIVHEYVDESGTRVVSRESVPPSETRLVQLPGMSVTDASVENDVDLQLRFSGGHAVLFVGDSAQYEMYRITIGDREIII